MDIRREYYLFQYSATGVLFYSMYCYQEELFRISGVVVPYPLIHISAGKETYSSEYNSLSREIKNEAGQVVASLTKSSENEYVLKDADGELQIVREMDCYYGKFENTMIFVARKIDNLCNIRRYIASRNMT